MSKKHTPRAVAVFSQFAKNVAAISFGTFCIHFIVKALSLALIGKYLFLDSDLEIMLHFFSAQMIPNIIAYGFLISVVFYLYIKTRRTMEILNNNEIEIARDQAVINTFQKITGLMAEYISVYNADIKEWIVSRQEKGLQPPMKLVAANDKISMALETLTKVGFVLPYVKSGSGKIEAYTDFLEKNLMEINKQRKPVLQIPGITEL